LGNGRCARLAGFHSRVGPDTIDFRFRFRFSVESPPSLSVAHTVSAECVTSLSVYFRFRPLSVNLYSWTTQPAVNNKL